MTAFSNDDFDLNTMSNENMITGLYHNPKYVNFVRKALPDLLYKGYLD